MVVPIVSIRALFVGPDPDGRRAARAMQPFKDPFRDHRQGAPRRNGGSDRADQRVGGKS